MDQASALPTAPADAASIDWLEQFGLLGIFGVAATVQFSIAIAQTLLALAAICWVSLVVSRREKIEAPRFFWWLLAYAGATLVSAAFSAQPKVSLIDCKQLSLFLIVPIAYRLVTGSRGSTMVTLVVSVGAASAAVGIFQYGVLHYNIAYRPRGTLGHYMTFSGLLMLVIGTALARVLFGTRDRLWSALVMPALAVAVMLTFTRSASVGVCAAAAVLLSLKDFRLVAILPIAAAVLFAIAPDQISRRFVSTFDMTDPTVQDRVAMLREGEHMVRDHPFVGVGPNMVEALYADYRDPGAVEQINPHLHNVPVQIAAERGIPALLIWLGFIGVLAYDVTKKLHDPRSRVAAAAAIAAIVAMLAAGLFEYNFGDSEFLMLFLILVTLPFAAVRPSPEDALSARA
jgi:O-antigen ligase